MEYCYCTRLIFLLLVILIYLVDSTATAYSVVGMVETTEGVHKEIGGATRTTRMKGRKMSAGDQLEKKDAVKGAKPCAVKCEVRFKSVHHSVSRVKLWSYVPFTSDYHGPKTHPPKNN
ncbi:hypothetical protein Cni_G04142 [Canna indica]|uniref:Uncharacterized protein n=1 Tax=Canna indica TaxID=4628 RepID=A0AAQ3JWB2_9LILI|nr:hypothetical protein Cni_G04142 [Canna indica]